MCETDDKNGIKTQFMSSQLFHRIPYRRVRKTTIWERLELEDPELFYPIAQEWTGFNLQQSTQNWKTEMATKSNPCESKNTTSHQSVQTKLERKLKADNRSRHEEPKLDEFTVEPSLIRGLSKLKHQNRIDNKNVALASRSDIGRDTSRIKRLTKISARTISACALIVNRTLSQKEIARLDLAEKQGNTHGEPSSKIKVFFHWDPK
jgi:hypothetical protein